MEKKIQCEADPTFDDPEIEQLLTQMESLSFN